jgi:hypothetical protein
MNTVTPDRKIAMIFNLSDLRHTAYKVHVLKAVFDTRFTMCNKHTLLCLLQCIWQTRCRFGIKQSVSWIWRSNNEEFRDLYCSPSSFFRVFTSRGIRWADHVARLSEMCPQDFVRNPERKRTLGTTRPSRGDMMWLSLKNDGGRNGFMWLRYEPWTDFCEYGLRQRYSLKSTARAIYACCVHKAHTNYHSWSCRYPLMP